MSILSNQSIILLTDIHKLDLSVRVCIVGLKVSEFWKENSYINITENQNRIYYKNLYCTVWSSTFLQFHCHFCFAYSLSGPKVPCQRTSYISYMATIVCPTIKLSVTGRQALISNTDYYCTYCVSLLEHFQN